VHLSVAHFEGDATRLNVPRCVVAGWRTRPALLR